MSFAIHFTSRAALTCASIQGYVKEIPSLRKTLARHYTQELDPISHFTSRSTRHQLEDAAHLLSNRIVLLAHKDDPCVRLALGHITSVPISTASVVILRSQSLYAQG